MATESRTGQPAVVEAVAPPAYDSLHPDETKQQPSPMAWPQGQVYQQVGGPPPVQYVAVSDRRYVKSIL